MKLIALIVKALVLIFFLILALLNTHAVPFAYVPGQEVQWPLILVLFLAFILGALFGIFALFGRLLRLRGENNRLRAEVQKAARLATQDIAAPAPQAAPLPAKSESV